MMVEQEGRPLLKFPTIQQFQGCLISEHVLTYFSTSVNQEENWHPPPGNLVGNEIQQPLPETNPKTLAGCQYNRNQTFKTFVNEEVLTPKSAEDSYLSMKSQNRFYLNKKRFLQFLSCLMMALKPVLNSLTMLAELSMMDNELIESLFSLAPLSSQSLVVTTLL